MNRISIFHYHLLPGGVTNVILHGARALIDYFPNLQLLRLVCGKSENTDQIKSRIEDEIDSIGLIGDSFEFEICIDPELDYTSRTGRIPKNETRALADRLIKKYGDSFWWIHNYQLGKNPLFTSSLIRIAENVPEQKILFHIHDFPECARYDNLGRLFSAGVKNPYPVTENTAYALINGRDTDILTKAGVPPEKVFLLNNPVEKEKTGAEPPDARTSADLKSKFFDHFAKHFPRIKPEGKILFYPVRTIRRKNALEAGLIASVSEQPVNLVLSLPGLSAQEKKYSAICERCFREGLIPGVWGSGTDDSPAVPPYPMMLQLADLILSSSVQEGFGYLFINSVILGAPLVARDLDIIDGIRSFFPDERTCFYKQFNVPLSKSEIGDLKKRYAEKLDRISCYISKPAADGISESISLIGADKTVDFSFLPVDKQVRILEQLKESQAVSDEIHSLNAELMNSFYKLLNSGRISAEADISAFSLKTHADNIERIINSLYREPAPAVKSDTDVQQRLLDHFARPDYMRLIYDC